MTNNGHIDPRNVPDLGALGKDAAKPRMGVTPSAFVRRLDGMGTFEPGLSKVTPQGLQVAPSRDQYLSAEDLLAEVRQVVREELTVMVEALREALASAAVPEDA